MSAWYKPVWATCPRKRSRNNGRSSGSTASSSSRKWVTAQELLPTIGTIGTTDKTDQIGTNEMTGMTETVIRGTKGTGIGTTTVTTRARATQEVVAVIGTILVDVRSPTSATLNSSEASSTEKTGTDSLLINN